MFESLCVCVCLCVNICFCVFMCVPPSELASVRLSPSIPWDGPHPVVTIVMILSPLPCALSQTHRAESRIHDSKLELQAAAAATAAAHFYKCES